MTERAFEKLADDLEADEDINLGPPDDDERTNHVPLDGQGRPDFASAAPDLCPYYGEFAEAAALWEDGDRAWFRASERVVEALAPVHEGTGKDKVLIAYQWRRLSGGLIPFAALRDEHGEGHSVLCRIRDVTGAVRKIVIPRGVIGGGPRDLGVLLSAAGLSYAQDSNTRQKIAEFLHERPLTQRWRSSARVGWCGASFVLPDETIAPEDAEPVVYHPPGGGRTSHAFNVKGTLEDWREAVAVPCEGNSRGVFVLSAAFAGPLLEPLGLQGGGFNLRGDSSSGKTTLGEVAGSVWGGGDAGFKKSWNTTANAAAGLAEQHNGMAMVLDELSEAEPRAVAAISYALANGQERARLTRESVLRDARHWRLIFISTGEKSVTAKIAEDGRNPRALAGQEVRVLDIRADAGAGLGVWDSAPGGGRALSDALKDASARHYGHAGREFVRRLIADKASGTVFVRDRKKAWIAARSLEDVSGQVHRAAERFALVAAAGELAAHYGILPFEDGECDRAAERLFDDWLKERGTDQNAEIGQAVDAVRGFLERHGASRFQRVDAGGDDITYVDTRVHERAGWTKDRGGERVYLFTLSAWKEACEGLDPMFVRRTLAERGLLETDAGRTDKRERIPDVGRVLTIAVKAAIFEA